MTDPEREPVGTDDETVRSTSAAVCGLLTTRRAFVRGVGALAVGTGVGSASEPGSEGYGMGGFGDGGFGIGGYRTVAYYADDDGVVRSDGVMAARDDWRSGIIDVSLLLEVISAWRSGAVVG